MADWCRALEQQKEYSNNKNETVYAFDISRNGNIGWRSHHWMHMQSVYKPRPARQTHALFGNA